jgi:hypothetical protein
MMFKDPTSSRPNRRPAHVPVVALLAAGAMGIAGCVSSGRFTEVEQERDLLAARYAALKGELDEANRTGETLAQEKVASRSACDRSRPRSSARSRRLMRCGWSGLIQAPARIRWTWSFGTALARSEDRSHALGNV